MNARTTGRQQCRKCGAELDPKQKVCPRCGELTPAGGKYDVEDEQHWRPSPTMIKVTAAVVAALIVAMILYHSLHVTPPEIAAKDWFDAMVSRSVGTAGDGATQGFKDRLQGKMSNLAVLADQLYDYVYSNEATYGAGEPVYRDKNHAEVIVSLTYAGNMPGPQVRIEMVKIGRRWLVDDVII